MTNSSRLTRGYTIALASAVFLSTTAIFIRYLTQTYHLPALVLAFWRAVFVFLTLLPVLALTRPALLSVSRSKVLFLIFYGLNLAIFNSLWTLSVSINGAAVATVLAYCSAGFTALLGWWFFHENLGWGKILAVLLSLGGCAMVAQALDPHAWAVNLMGILAGVLGGLWYAFYTLLGRSAAQRGLNPWTTLLYTFAFAALFLLAFNLLSGGRLPGTASAPSDLFWLKDHWAGWGVLLLLAAGPTVAGFGTYNISLTYLPSSVVNLVVTLEPVFTAVIAYVFLGEQLTWVQILGGVLILAGVVFLRFSEAGQLRKMPAKPDGPSPQ